MSKPRAHALYLAALLAVKFLTPPVFAFDPAGNSWPSGTVPILLQLDATKPTNVSFPLIDGATSWNALAAQVLDDWNSNLGRIRFTSTTSTSAAAAYEEGATPKINNVTFSDTRYGLSFGVGTLAITLSDQSFRKNQADIIVNKAAYIWNSYRGALRSSGPDFRRVLLHELGHVVGLNHPDQASPAQSVSSIMNSVVSNSETLQLDDINGAKFLYTVTTKPAITSQPVNQTVSVTGTASFSASVDGQSAVTSNAIRDYTWYFAPTGSNDFEPLFTINNSTKLDFPLAQLIDAGRYYFAVTTPDDTVVSTTATLTVNPIALSTTAQLANVATRGVAGSGTNSMIVGFVITGAKPKRVLLRGVGPTLQSSFQVPGTLADPILTLKNSAGTTVATNDNWGQPIAPATATAAEIRSTSASVGAFPLAEGSADSVMLLSLAPGSYTAIVSSPTNASGVVLLEAYDADSPADPTIRLANLSTRGQVGTGADIIIAGFVVNGLGPKTYLIRAVGDTLKDFNVTGTLDDPYLKLYRGDGTLLRETDDWDSPATAQPALRAAFAKVQAFELKDRQESAMLVTLPPGSYSAQMSGLGGTTGVGLIEVYEIPN